MNAVPATISKRTKRWQWPLDLGRYDRSPSVSTAELKEIRILLKNEWRGRYRMEAWARRLDRVVRPILDAQKLFPSSYQHRAAVIRVILTEVHRRRSSFWSWSGRSWMTICATSRSAFGMRYGSHGDARASLMAIAVALKRPIDLNKCGVFEKVLLAQKVFGEQVVDDAVKRVIDALDGWGYGKSHKAHDESVLCEAMLLSGSPLLEDVPREILADLYTQCVPIQRRYAIHRLSLVLYQLGFIEAPLQRVWPVLRSGLPI